MEEAVRRNQGVDRVVHEDEEALEVPCSLSVDKLLPLPATCSAVDLLGIPVAEVLLDVQILLQIPEARAVPNHQRVHSNRL